MVPNSWFRRMGLTVASAFGLGYLATDQANVAQITSRTTGVTSSGYTGSITLVSAAGSTTPASFTVTNDKVAIGDTIIVNQVSGADLYTLSVTNIAAGSFQITFNTKSGTTVEQPVFTYSIIRGTRVF